MARAESKVARYKSTKLKRKATCAIAGSGVECAIARSSVDDPGNSCERSAIGATRNTTSWLIILVDN